MQSLVALQVSEVMNILGTLIQFLSVGASDFESLSEIIVENNMAEVRVFASNDQITLEYDDSVILTYIPDNPLLIPGLEGLGEYIRHTATVNIIDNDSEAAYFT